MTVKIIKSSRTAYMRARYAKSFTNQLSCCHLSSSLQPVYNDIPPSLITGGLSPCDLVICPFIVNTAAKVSKLFEN